MPRGVREPNVLKARPNQHAFYKPSSSIGLWKNQRLLNCPLGLTRLGRVDRALRSDNRPLQTRGRSAAIQTCCRLNTQIP